MVMQLADAARTDPLTGLLNRRGFEEAFELELERARRSEHALGVLIGDLDGFKKVNDVFGHHAGDQALARAGAVLGREKRRIDRLARFGGEEFALVAPDTDERRGLHAGRAVAHRAARRVRRRRGPAHDQLRSRHASRSTARRGRSSSAPPTTRCTRPRS